MKRNSIFIFILAALPAIQPTAPALGAVSVTTSQQSAAIAFSACTFGTLGAFEKDPVSKLRIEGTIELAFWYRLYEEDLLPKDNPIVKNYRDNEVVRVGYENTVQGFTTAATLSSRWKSLPSLLEKAFQIGTKKWQSGSTLGVAGKAANAASSSKILAICRVAKSQVFNDAKKAGMTLKEWIIYAGKDLLPELHVSSKEVK